MKPTVNTPRKAKKGYLPLVLLLDALALGLIPLNLFILRMPEFVSLILSACVLLSALLLWIKGTQKKVLKTLVSLFSLIAVLFSLFGAYCSPYWNSLNFRDGADMRLKDDNAVLTREQALADLDYAMKYLKKLHPALYGEVPEAVERQYELSRRQLASMEEVDVCTLSQAVESVFSPLGDAHTHAGAWYNEYHYLKYIYAHNQAGDLLVKINGMTMDELFQKNKHLFSYEYEEYGMTRLDNYISTSEGLQYLGISVEGGAEFTYEDKNGAETSYTYTGEDFVPYDEYLEFNGLDSTSGESMPFVRYEIDEGRSLAILTLDSCDNNAAYKSCLAEMFREVKDMNIRHVAVDLRNNGGGDSSVANEFFRYLDVDSYRDWSDVWRLGIFMIPYQGREIQNDKYEDLLFDGELYLLTSVYTFSSAMDFAEFVKDNHMGTIIGQASGNDPSAYGNIAFFTLPNSGILMQISTKQWHRIDESLEHQPIEPDIPCGPWEAEEYLYQAIAG